MYYENFEFLTVNDVMDLLCIGRNTAYSLLNSGQLKGFRIGRSWRITREAINDYVLNQTTHH